MVLQTWSQNTEKIAVVKYEHSFWQSFRQNYQTKEPKGKDIIVYGGASFDSSLIRAGLIDEFHLFINPVAIGNGMTIFKDLNKIQKFNLIKSVAFDCGIIGLQYEPKRGR
jgi:dihydrofolate reductase